MCTGFEPTDGETQKELKMRKRDRIYINDDVNECTDYRMNIIYMILP